MATTWQRGLSLDETGFFISGTSDRTTAGGGPEVDFDIGNYQRSETQRLNEKGSCDRPNI